MQGARIPIERKVNTFFLEMILAMAFLALSSGVLIQLFAGAYMASQQSGDINRAVLAAQNASSCFKGAHGDAQETALLLGGEAEGGTVRISYDSNLAPVAGGEYQMVMVISGEAPLFAAEISFFKDGSLIYSINAAYFAREGGLP